MDPTIQALLDSPPDYSAAFTAEIRRLGAMAEGRVGRGAAYDFDMNYNSSNKIEFLSGSGVSLGDHLKSVFIVSSRGKVFMVRTLFLDEGSLVEPGPYGRLRWRAAMPSELDAGTRDLQRIVEELLISEGYANLDGDVLDEMADGHLTGLDGVPATVGEVLYGELIP